MEERKISNGKFFFILLILIIVSTILWARFISTKGLKVFEYPVYDQRITKDMDGLKIVHFSDILYGRTVNKKDITKLVDKINELKPDIVIFTGNLIDKDTIINNNLTDDISKELSKIEAKLGKYAISGNQDYKIENYDIVIKNAGFTYLSNSSELIYYNGSTPLLIAGFPSSLKEDLNIQETLNQFNDQEIYKIILTHEPDNFDKFKDYNIDLVLSGHSLNGQIRIPYVGKIISKQGSKKYYDKYYNINDIEFYISGGIGTTDYSYRWFNKPSINFYRLYNK